MTTPTGSDILEQLFTVMRADAQLMALVGNRIYNHIPQDSPLPCLRARWDSVNEWDTKTSDGYDGNITVDIWSSHRGDKEALAIFDRTYSLLHKSELPLTSGQSLLLRYTMSDSFLEPDGLTHHTVIRFRLIATS